MITIPFYNHYFNRSETGKTMISIFGMMGASIVELPCLCKYPSDNKVNQPIAVIHGTRENDRECYEKLKSQMVANPETNFYVWAVNWGSNDAAKVLTDKEISPPNCRIIDMRNITTCVEEIKGLISKLPK